jgi:predicted MFS family arabinose efflux permease
VIAWVGAPVSLLAAAVVHLVSVVVLATLPVDEPTPARRQRLGRAIASGVRYVHRHPLLGPFARWTHVWFLCNGAAMTLLVPLVLLDLDAGPAGLGLALGVLGGATLVGTALAAVVAGRLGSGRTIVVAKAAYPIAWGCVAVAGIAELGSGAALVIVLAGLAIAGLAMGIDNPSEMALRQRVTPDSMQSRMNATMRTVNRAMIVVAAPVAGLVGDAIGFAPALAVVAVGFVVAAVGMARSPLARRAR